MKKILISAIFCTTLSVFQAQELRSGLREAPAYQNREGMRRMSPNERQNMLQAARENMMLENLNINEGQKENFKNMYSEYQEEQRRIKSRFNNNFDPDRLSDAQAEQKLEESFAVGEELLRSRRDYAQKMRSMMKPQQILKMFRTEGMIREKTLERRNAIQDSQNAAQPLREGTNRPSAHPGYRDGMPRK